MAIPSVVYNAASTLYGWLNAKRHMAMFPVLPGAGDYTSPLGDSDVNPTTNVATAWADGTIQLDPSTTIPIVSKPARITGGSSGVIKASPASLLSFVIVNTQASLRYFQVYNKATAGVPGTDTPLATIPLAANGVSQLSLLSGMYGSVGLSWAVTTDAAGTTAGAANDTLGTVFYVG